jgi:hypothetical protein
LCDLHIYVYCALIIHTNVTIIYDNLIRYAIGHAERSGDNRDIGWLASLADATNQPYKANDTGGPSIKVRLAFRPPRKTLHNPSGQYFRVLSVLLHI